MFRKFYPYIDYQSQLKQTVMPIFQKPTAKVSIVPRLSVISSTASSLLERSTEIRVVTSKDYKAAAVCLSNAFSKDEVAGYFLDCPDTACWSDERRWELHAEIMDAITYAHVKFGAVHAIGDIHDGAYDAVALWMPPGTNMDSYLALFRTGVLCKGLVAFTKLSKEGRIRMFKEFIPLLSIAKTEILKERDSTSWYLVYLGTHSRARGRGLAKKLVNRVTQQVSSATPSLLMKFAE